jgi:hypothetical protein
LTTRAKDRQLQIRRRASQGNYAGLAPTEHTANHPPPVIVATETTAAPTPQQHSKAEEPIGHLGQIIGATKRVVKKMARMIVNQS